MIDKRDVREAIKEFDYHIETGILPNGNWWGPEHGNLCAKTINTIKQCLEEQLNDDR